MHAVKTILIIRLIVLFFPRGEMNLLYGKDDNSYGCMGNRELQENKLRKEEGGEKKKKKIFYVLHLG